MIELISVAGAVMFVACTVRGNRQRRELGVTHLRVLATAVLMTVVTEVPLLAALLTGGTAGHLVQYEAVHTHRMVAQPASWQVGRLDILVAAVAALLTARVLFASLRPLGPLERHARLPELTDAATLGRIRELATSLRAAMPRVKVRGSAGPTLETNAFAGGLLAPVIVVLDGVLHRLPANERDAVLAHELGHIARRSILFRCAVLIAATWLAVAASALTSPWVAIALVLVLPLGAGRGYAHRDELQCDLAAARATSFPTVAKALAKIHAIAGIPPGWRGAVVHALLGHPTLALRRDSLNRHEPAGSRAAPDEAARDRTIGWLVLLGWALVVLAATAAGRHRAGEPPAVLGLGLVLLAPFVAVLLCRLRDLVELWRLGLLRPSLATVTALAGFLLAAVSLAVVEIFGATPMVASGLLAALLLLGTSPLLQRRERRLVARVRAALGAQDFADAMAAFGQLSARAQQRSRHVQTLATILAASGDPGAAIALLERRLAAAPRDRAVRFRLATLLAPRDPASALELAEDLRRRTPRSWSLAMLCSAALRRLGRLDEARTEIERALDLYPGNGFAHASAARVAAAAGRLDEARAHLLEAEQRQPGDALLAITTAEVEVAAGDREAAARTLAEARERAGRQPLADLGPDLDALERRLGEQAGQ